MFVFLIHRTTQNVLECMFPSCFRKGFGLLDAGLIVQQAARFGTVAPWKKCIQEVTLHPTR